MKFPVPCTAVTVERVPDSSSSLLPGRSGPSSLDDVAPVCQVLFTPRLAQGSWPAGLAEHTVWGFPLGLYFCSFSRVQLGRAVEKPQVTWSLLP